LSCAFGQPSSSIDTPLFLPNGHGQEEDSVLSPQEREIMADITLDPDDDSTAWVWGAGTKNNAHDRAHDASAVFKDNNSKGVGASANVLQVCNPSTPSSSPVRLLFVFFVFFFLPWLSALRAGFGANGVFCPLWAARPFYSKYIKKSQDRRPSQPHHSGTYWLHHYRRRNHPLPSRRRQRLSLPRRLPRWPREHPHRCRHRIPPPKRCRIWTAAPTGTRGANT
jgi:hypothetical protein